MQILQLQSASQKNIASLAVFCYRFHNPRHTVKILLIMSQSSSHKICKVIEPVASISELLQSLVKILQLFLQQNRLHQVQKNVPINDYFTFVTVVPILKKVQHNGLKRYFLFF